jgi:hypothetical protein
MLGSAAFVAMLAGSAPIEAEVVVVGDPRFCDVAMAQPGKGLYLDRDPDTFSASFAVRATLTNRTGRPLLLPRELQVAPLERVAASPDLGRQGVYELEFWGDVFLQESPKLAATPAGSGLVIVPPGGAHVTNHVWGVLVTREGRAPIAGSVAPGRHWFQMVVYTYPDGVPPDELRRAAKHWRSYGALFRDEVATNWAAFEVPGNPESEPCEAAAPQARVISGDRPFGERP